MEQIYVIEYQSMPKEERAKITMNGEPVLEIDVRASYLTILYGIMGNRRQPIRDLLDPVKSIETGYDKLNRTILIFVK